LSGKHSVSLHHHLVAMLMQVEVAPRIILKLILLIILIKIKF